MPSSFNGTGTKYYGHADPSDSGSYTATEWIVLLWIPIFPLRSWRVGSHRKGKDTLLFSNEKFYVKRVPLNVRQVVLGYLCTVAVIAVPLVVWWGLKALESAVSGG
jgi:fatty-acid desaturase